MTLLQSPLLPNLLYLFLIAGLWLAALAVVTPGTGFYEVLAILTLAGVGWGTIYVPLDGWAFLPLALGAVFYGVSLRRRREALWLALAAVAFSLGSVYLFRTDEGGPAVHPLLAVVTSLLTLGYFWVIVRKAIVAQLARPSIDPSAVLGQVGVVRTPIEPMGAVYVAGELWTAQAEASIPVGASVRVIGREGLILTVVPEEAPDSEPSD